MIQKRIVLSLLVTPALVFSFSTTTFAMHRVDVLGESTTAPVEMPATIEGPGFILPDSPFYFLDQMKQKIRVSLAFSPEAKAKVQSDIAGERFAEVRFMLEKNDKKAAEKALAGMAESTENASKNLDAAKLRGIDTTVLARTINDQIKRREETLSDVEQEATGEVKASVMLTRASLDSSKVKVEDHLPQDELNQAIEDRLERNMEDSIKDASDSAEGFERSIKLLSGMASEAAKKNQIERKAALQTAIEKKNKQQQREVELKEKAEGEKEKKVVEIKAEEAETARKMVNMAKEAAVRMEAAKRAEAITKSTEK